MERRGINKVINVEDITNITYDSLKYAIIDFYILSINRDKPTIAYFHRGV